MNLYAYAGNNPSSFGDPWGLCEVRDAVGIDGRRVYRKVKVVPGMLSWVVFRP